MSLSGHARDIGGGGQPGFKYTAIRDCHWWSLGTVLSPRELCVSGRLLRINYTGRFSNNAEANDMLTRKYRAPFGESLNHSDSSTRRLTWFSGIAACPAHLRLRYTVIQK